MGLFGKKLPCIICNNNDGKLKIKGGRICKECYDLSYKYLPSNKHTFELVEEDLKTAIEQATENKKLLAEFTPTKKIDKYIEFDEEKKQWLIPDGFFGTKINPHIYNYSDIHEYELLEDGDSITKGGLGRAVAGGILLGGVGAIVGGVTGGKKTKSIINSLKIKITINDINNPVVYINLINSKTKSNSSSYKNAYKYAQEILSVFSIIQDSNSKNNLDTNPTTSETTFSVADELIKLKDLLESGILTQAEFDEQKNKLLNK